jgi:hypothetical protein
MTVVNDKPASNDGLVQCKAEVMEFLAVDRFDEL